MYTHVKPCRIFPEASDCHGIFDYQNSGFPYLSIYVSIYLSLYINLLSLWCWSCFASFCCTSRRPCIRFPTWLSPLSLSEPTVGKALMSRTQLEAQYDRTYPLPSGSLNGHGSWQVIRNRTFLLVTMSVWPSKYKPDLYRHLKTKSGNGCFCGKKIKKVMMLIFGTVSPIIKHLIKSLNMYGTQNMHIRIKHIRHNQHYNYISPVAWAHLCCSANKQWFRTFCPSVKINK